MPKLTLLLIPLLFFMTSCTIDWNDEKEAKIAELEKQIQDDTFKKNQECEKYIDKIDKKNREKEEISAKIGFLEFHLMKEVFYSRKYSTCIAISDYSYEFPERNGKKGSKGESIQILDIFSNKVTIYHKSQTGAIESFNEAVIDLKSSNTLK